MRLFGHSSVRSLGCVALASASLLLGCNRCTIVQRNIFSDEDGYVVTVDYGRSESEHVNTFISPMTGKEMEFRSRLMLYVELPDGESLKAWQCMNFQRTGTMYRTDNDEWMVWANGFSCVVYQQLEDDKTRYREVYRGVLCESPKIDVEKNDKWKVLPRSGGRRERIKK